MVQSKSIYRWITGIMSPWWGLPNCFEPPLPKRFATVTNDKYINMPTFHFVLIISIISINTLIKYIRHKYYFKRFKYNYVLVYYL